MRHYSAEQYEDLYDRDLGEEEYAEAICHKGVKVYRRKDTTAGPVKNIELCAVWNAQAEARRAKEARRAQSKQAIENRNWRNTEKRIAALVNENFSDGKSCAMYLTAGNSSADLRAGFRWLMREARKAAGAQRGEVKYLYILEDCDRDGKPIHPHIHAFFNGILSRDWYEDMWRERYGIANGTRLFPDENGLTGFATYVQKAPREIRRARRWACSRNLRRPQPRRSTRLPGGKLITKKLLLDITTGKKDAKELFERAYPGWAFVNMQVRRSDYVSGVYVDIRMQRLREGRRKNE